LRVRIDRDGLPSGSDRGAIIGLPVSVARLTIGKNATPAAKSPLLPLIDLLGIGAQLSSPT
jgi:hypothetical protein